MQPTAIVYITAEAVVGLLTTIGNCLVLAVIIRTPQLHTVTNMFVGSLAVADIAVGVLVGPCAALSFLGLPRDFYACIFINCLILMFTNVSILMLMSVAIERFIAIKEPFVYQRILTVKRAIYINFLVWIVGCILGLVPMYGWHRGYHTVEYCSFTSMISYEYMVYFQFFGLVLLPLFIMLCIYIYILLIVRKHMKQTTALHTQFRQNKDAKDGFNKDVKAAKVFALVILLFGIFWFPVNLFNCVSLFCGAACPFPLEALLVAIVMSHANSSINPFLYATSNSRIKRGLKELFRIKQSPQDRENTDYYKHRTSNGFSYARDNSVAPITNVEESTRQSGDRTNIFTVSSKTMSPNGNISVLPADQSHNNSVSPVISNGGNQHHHTQNQSNNTSHSSISNHTYSEGKLERPHQNSQDSHPHAEQDLDPAVASQNEANKPRTVLPVAQHPDKQLGNLTTNNSTANGHHILIHGNHEATKAINTESLNQITCDNSENRHNLQVSTFDNTDSVKSAILNDNTQHKFPNTPSASAGILPSVVFETGGNNSSSNIDSTIDNNNHNNVKTDGPLMSSVLTDDFGKQRNSDTLHTKL